MYKYDAVVASNTEVTVWERSKATAQRSLRSGRRIDRGSGAEKTRDFKNAAIKVLATVAAAPWPAGDETDVELLRRDPRVLI